MVNVCAFYSSWNVSPLISQGLAFGIGSGGVFRTALICVAQWFDRRPGLAVGIAWEAVWELSKKIGLHGAIRYSTLIIGILLALPCFWNRARLPRKKWDPSQRWLDLTMLKRSSSRFAFWEASSLCECNRIP
ncbi:uncharacterized protein BCR38DRAFT_405240 [Pseudomassariella vexata]|uniref:Major facilitator superfamily domain-containing protein n=1 Tax=Pseudomassariella vexata TaxID=1141098 RepID=A0A1Y2ED76_9PEZI|nr:uncharacterized protein BCR38DRAFT_405240 [Pseudomassariella vexata]ORY69529.1 hypothetical protein BCR38DRAFT_405240 [Pseudomassariella vexata]